MYEPRHFQLTDLAEMATIVREYPLATLIAGEGAPLEINHIPMMLHQPTAGEWILKCHVARANPVWQTLQTSSSVMAIFCGVQAYISPNWYASKKRDGKVVPTWNYEAVHVSGIAAVHDDVGWLAAFLDELTGVHEAAQPKPWAVSDAPNDYVAMRLKDIVGIEIKVTGMQAKAKLSQNQSPENRRSLIDGLRGALPGSEPADQLSDASRRRMSDQIPPAD